MNPLVRREELVEALMKELKIKDGGEVEVKMLRRDPWGTQLAIIVLPKASIDNGGDDNK